MTSDRRSREGDGWIPPASGPARWVVYERTGYWATALRRESEALGARIDEVRSLAECAELLERAAGTFAVIELTHTNAEKVLDFLARIPREFPLVRVVIVAESALAEYEDLLREAGAVHFLTSPRRLEALVGAVKRHLGQVPAPPRSRGEQIWADLPWGKKGA